MKQKDYVKDLFTFVENSPTCFQAVEQMEERLKAKGYHVLYEKTEWHLKAGEKYYVTRNDSSVIAFSIPKGKIKGFHIAAAHSDSPCFKLKEIAELAPEGQYLKWNVEKYGGMILSTWLDRPLSIAGRVVVKTGEGFESRLVNIDRDVAVIPNVAIHMNRDMNKGIEYNPQTDMSPLAGEALDGGCYKKMLAEAAGVEEEDILGQDIFLYNRDKCTRLGVNGDFLGGPRLDDLECAYACTEAMPEETAEEYVNMLAVFDNEEIGSGTGQGADSTFLRDVMGRIRCGLALTEEAFACMLADSFLISADNAHALHPNHPEKADPVNRPYLNGGIVLKYHGSAKYATDAYSGAVMKDICKRAGVPYQVYENRSDIVGGSTLGNILMAQVSMNAVDIGLPQLAMHSAYETAGAKDVEDLIKALKVFYQ